eukprot:Hpha_TRINITY_DN13195_c0_g1::TRINITY_DN13195_c0_g1_i1::g.113620::m.113620
MNFVALLLGTALGGCDQHRCTPNSNWDCDTHDVDVAQSSCDADTNCTWVWMLGCDGGAQCCFPKDACIVNPSMSSCMSDPKCNWQEGAYRVNDMRFCAEDPKPCYKYTSKCECRADRSCEWDANNSSCGWIRRKVGTCTDSCDCYHKDECFKNDTCSFVNFARGGDAGKQEDWGCKELHDGTQHPCFRYIYGSQYCNKDTRCQWDYSDPTIKGGRCRARGRAYPDSEHNVTGCEQYEEKQHCEDPTLSPGLNLTCEWVMYKGCRNATAPHTPTPVDSDACALHLSNISSCLSDQKCVYLRKPPTAKDYGFPCQELPDRQVCYKITDECQCGGDLCEWKAESCVRREVCNVCECNVDYRQCWQNDTCDFPAGSGGACGVRDGTKHPCLRYGKEEDACKMDDRCFWALDDTDRSEGCSAWNVLDPLVRFSSSSVRECHNHDFMNSCQANATCEWVMYKGCRVNKDTVVTTSPTLAPTALGGCDQHRCTPNSNWDCDTHDVDVAQSSCDADTNCTWVWMLGCDGGAQCCFPKDACIVNPSMSSCMSDPKCNWQEGAYRVNDMRFCAEDPKPCYKYTSKCECRADRSCEWDANNSSCGWIRRKVGTCTDSCDCYHKDECFKNDTCSFVNFARGGDAGKQEDWGCKELHDGTQHPC